MIRSGDRFYCWNPNTIYANSLQPSHRPTGALSIASFLSQTNNRAKISSVNGYPALMIPIPTPVQRPSTSEGHPNLKPPIIKLPDRNSDSPDLQPIQPASPYRNGLIHLGTCSPVNENGSFLFDQVLKSGKVNRRLKHRHVSDTHPTSLAYPTDSILSRHSELHGNPDISFSDRTSCQSTKTKNRPDLDCQSPYQKLRLLPRCDPHDQVANTSLASLLLRRITGSKRQRKEKQRTGLSAFAPKPVSTKRTKSFWPSPAAL